MKTRLTLGAVRQIEAALDFVARESPTGAGRISNRIDATINLIGQYPEAGQVTSRPGVRRVVLAPFPFAIFYRIGKNEVVIMRFRHTSRKPV